MGTMQKVAVPATPSTDGWARLRHALSAEQARLGMKLSAALVLSCFAAIILWGRFGTLKALFGKPLF